MSKIEEKILTVKWTQAEDNMIKFDEIKEAFDVSEKIMGFGLEKAGLVSGKKVNVKIDYDEVGGTGNGTVVFVTKAEGKKEETKQENTSTEKVNNDTYTVAGISYKTNAITFEEEKGVWYTISAPVTMDNVKKFGIKKGIKVTIKTQKTEDGKNDNLIFIRKADGGSETKNYNSSKPRTENSNVQTSIEAQASVNSASNLVGQIMAGQSTVTILEKKEDIVTLINQIAENNFKKIQELKNK
jgi:hypothetical protein